MVFGLVGRHSCTLKSIMTCKDMFTLALVLLEFCNLGEKMDSSQIYFCLRAKSRGSPFSNFSLGTKIEDHKIEDKAVAL